MFFSTYETAKNLIGKTFPEKKHSPFAHMAAAACGETVRSLRLWLLGRPAESR